ncbi:hypothetical protein ACFQV2_37550 [Actinokineospora soli]|uniref:Adhesin n=1 Tax=Actinokineospora soli TaxID=1048753 RepID=A0ABW2TWF7_9PSEU
MSGAASVEATSGRVELTDVGENASVEVQSGDVGVTGVRGTPPCGRHRGPSR